MVFCKRRAFLCATICTFALKSNYMRHSEANAHFLSLVQQYYDVREAQQLFHMAAEAITGKSRIDWQLSSRPWTEAEWEQLQQYAQQLAEGQPIQYVLGYAYFYNRKFTVNPHVLIPRVETEELVQKVLSLINTGNSILDIGTGSGCIAISLALEAQAKNVIVSACDISEAALTVAKENAHALHASVHFFQQNALDVEGFTAPTQHIIVSNPPYVCMQEMGEMAKHVKEFEPHLALFVPDENPLVFYASIASIAQKLLITGGYLCFEINQQYGKEVASLLQKKGFTEVSLYADMYQNDRMVIGKWQ